MRTIRMTAGLGRSSLVLLAALLSASAEAADRFVSRTGSDASNVCTTATSPCKTVAHALGQAANGDTIKIAAGTFREFLAVDSSLTITLSGGWAPDFAVQDARQNVTNLRKSSTADRIVSVDGDASEVIDVTLDGLVLRGATFTAVQVVSSHGASVTVSIRRCTITNNRGPSGAGILAWSGTAGSPSASLAISIEDSVLSSNTANVNNASVGGAVRATSGTPTHPLTFAMKNSVVARNSSRTQGGGMVIGGSAIDVSLTNVAMTKNSSRRGQGGGLSIGGAGTATLRNVIAWGNRALEADDVLVAESGGTLTLTIDHNDIGEQVIESGAVNDLGGHVSVDPQFVKSSSDFHLKSSSPLIDAGTCMGAPATDFEGDARPTGGGCDIGADEVAP